MPRYDYKCESCGVRYERREGFDAPQEHTCEQCGSGVARRVFVAPPILFKGSGWYITDSRSGSSAATGTSPTPKAESDATPPGATTDAAKLAESKPAETKSEAPAPATSSSS
jgi:putative FmdB family regulatory protein